MICDTSFSFAGRVSVVTGASSGIGEAIARCLAELGAMVARCSPGDLDCYEACLVCGVLDVARLLLWAWEPR